MYVCRPEEGIRPHHRWLWVTMWLLGTELRTFGRAGNAPNLWAISAALADIFWEDLVYSWTSLAYIGSPCCEQNKTATPDGPCQSPQSGCEAEGQGLRPAWATRDPILSEWMDGWIKLNTKSHQDSKTAGSVGKKTCHHVWWLDLNVQDPHGEGKRNISESCSLTSIWVLSTCSPPR